MYWACIEFLVVHCGFRNNENFFRVNIVDSECESKATNYYFLFRTLCFSKVDSQPQLCFPVQTFCSFSSFFPLWNRHFDVARKINLFFFRPAYIFPFLILFEKDFGTKYILEQLPLKSQAWNKFHKLLLLSPSVSIYNVNFSIIRFIFERRKTIWYWTLQISNTIWVLLCSVSLFLCWLFYYSEDICEKN